MASMYSWERPIGFKPNNDRWGLSLAPSSALALSTSSRALSSSYRHLITASSQVRKQFYAPQKGQQRLMSSTQLRSKMV